MPEHLSLQYVKDKHIADVLASVGGNKAHAAKILRISRRTLFRILEERKAPKAEP
jgi:ActR/RegA family two-component response regulator